MIEEQFVSFETAKMLKEAGFDVPCTSQYTEGKYIWNVDYPYNFNQDEFGYSRPTQALAARWLREVHNIHLFVNYFFEDNKWFYVTVDLTESDEVKATHLNESNYESYEAALEAGLKHGLELVKK